jgi:hypothetical protein
MLPGLAQLLDHELRPIPLMHAETAGHEYHLTWQAALASALDVFPHHSRDAPGPVT